MTAEEDQRGDAAREAAESDPLDADLAARVPGHASIPLAFILFRTRPALGVPLVFAPALLFVPLGFAIGPRGLGWLPPLALGYLDPVVTVALAVFGIVAGMALGLRRKEDRQLAVIASVEAIVAGGLVAAGLVFLLPAWRFPLDLSLASTVVALGIVAAASSARPGRAERSAEHRRMATLADLDDVVPIVMAGVLMAALQRPDIPGTLQLTGATAAVGFACAIAYWMLAGIPAGESERDIFSFGGVLLVAGSAAYLSLSPLLAGLVAGFAWRSLPGGAAFEAVPAVVAKLRHPAVVLLFLIAGASFTPSREVVWLTAALVVLRIAGKVAGGWAASALDRRLPAGLLASQLLSPGVIGLGFALNVQQAAGSLAAVVVSSAVAATLVFEVLALATVVVRGGD